MSPRYTGTQLSDWTVTSSLGAMTVLLGVDFGTSNTVAVLRFPDGRARPLLFDGSPIMPSAVFADDRTLLVGRDAEHAARTRPERFEPNPKRRIDDGTVLLGGREVAVVDLFAAVLRRVRARRRGSPAAAPRRPSPTRPAGDGPPGSCCARPPGPVWPTPGWYRSRWPRPRYFVGTRAQVPVGASIVIYDFGAGTFDASVVRRDPAGFTVSASEGLTTPAGWTSTRRSSTISALHRRPRPRARGSGWTGRSTTPTGGPTGCSGRTSGRRRRCCRAPRRRSTCRSSRRAAAHPGAVGAAGPAGPGPYGRRHPRRPSAGPG